jgi:hypothetical protein
MSEGISVEEACRINALSAEDAERLCNFDYEPTTTFVLYNDPSKSFTVKNSHLEWAAMAAVVLIFFIVVFFVARKLLRKKRKK